MTAACTSNSQTTLPEALPAGAEEDYRIAVGEELRITVFGHEDLSMESVTVNGAGRITTPLSGDLRVVGLTQKEVEELIEAALSPKYLKNPVVSVEVLEHRSCYIIGEVVHPGSSCRCVPGMRAVAILRLCRGGFTYRAVEDEFIIMRDGKAIRGGPETLVMPGDVIELQERYF